MITTAEKWRIGLALLAAAVFFAADVVLLIRYATGARGAAVESKPLHRIPNTDVNPFGANFFLQWEADLFKREKTVQMAAEAGIGWAKQHFPWEDIEPAPSQYRWEKYDQIVDLYRRYGLEVIARLDRPPDWTRQDNRFKERPPDDFNDYGEFVYQFVRHFRGRVRYLQIWNEPNLFQEWGAQPADPEAYTKLLAIAYRRAKEADPNVYILSAPLAITTEEVEFRGNMSDLTFLERMYQAGARDYFDILSANAFGMDRPPWDPPSPEVLNFRRVELQRRIMERYGDGNKPVWFNEYGWNAAPPGFPPEKLIWQRVSEEQQAAWTVEGIRWARKRWPWAGVFNIWYFRQIGNLSPQDPDYYFRMVDVDFAPRPVYYAVQQATRDLSVAGPGYHQETAPAVRYGAALAGAADQKTDGGWQPRIQPRASAQADLVGRVRGAVLRFAFRGSGVELIARRAPDAGRLAVTIDGRPVPGLPTVEQGGSLLDLRADGETWQARMPIATGLAPRVHTLELAVLEPPVTVDGFVVFGEKAARFPILRLALFALGFLAAGWQVYRDVGRIAQRVP